MSTEIQEQIVAPPPVVEQQNAQSSIQQTLSPTHMQISQGLALLKRAANSTEISSSDDDEAGQLMNLDKAPEQAFEHNVYDQNATMHQHQHQEDHQGVQQTEGNDTYCGICGLEGELMLLCDGICGRSFHLECLQLEEVPEDEQWLCRNCQTLVAESLYDKDPSTRPHAAEYDAILDVLESVEDDEGRNRSFQFRFLPDESSLPEYYETITSPISMDQLRRRHYDQPEEFRDAWALLVKNAKTFNKRGSPVYSDACALDPIFKSTFAKYFPTIAKTPGRPKGSQIISGGDPKSTAPVNLNNNNVLGAKVKNLLNSDDIYSYNDRDLDDDEEFKERDKQKYKYYSGKRKSNKKNEEDEDVEFESSDSDPDVSIGNLDTGIGRPPGKSSSAPKIPAPKKERKKTAHGQAFPSAAAAISQPEIVPTPLNLPEGATEDEVLAAKIGGNHVKAVSFHGDRFPDAFVDAVSKSLVLKAVSWLKDSLSLPTMEKISKALGASRSIDRISLNATKVGDQAISALCKSLHHTNTLTYLNLHYNNISVVGATEVANLLVHNPNIVELNLSNNPLRDPGIAVLIAALEKNTSLEILNLSRTFYEENTLIGFANLFNGKNRTLRKLVLKVGPKEQKYADSIRRLTEAVASNPDLSWDNEMRSRGPPKRGYYKSPVRATKGKKEDGDEDDEEGEEYDDSHLTTTTTQTTQQQYLPTTQPPLQVQYIPDPNAAYLDPQQYQLQLQQQQQYQQQQQMMVPQQLQAEKPAKKKRETKPKVETQPKRQNTKRTAEDQIGEQLLSSLASGTLEDVSNLKRKNDGKKAEPKSKKQKTDNSTNGSNSDMEPAKLDSLINELEWDSATSVRLSESTFPQKLLDALCKNISCKELSWVGRSFSGDMIDKLLTLLQTNSRFQTLSLAGASLGESTTERIIGLLSTFPSLKSLDLSDNHFSSANTIRALTSLVNSSKTLNHLDLSSNKVGANLLSFLTSLSSNRTLESLVLSDCNLDDQAVTSLSSVLSGKTSLKSVNLSNNPLITFGAIEQLRQSARSAVQIISDQTNPNPNATSTSSESKATSTTNAAGEKEDVVDLIED